MCKDADPRKDIQENYVNYALGRHENIYTEKQ